MQVEITNVKEVENWIGLQVKTSIKEFLAIIKGTALTIMSSAKRRAPVITGRYRSSIHIEADGMPSAFSYTDENGNTFDGSFSEKPGEGEYFVGTNVIYAGKVEKMHKVLEEATVDGQWYLTRKANESNK